MFGWGLKPKLRHVASMVIPNSVGMRLRARSRVFGEAYERGTWGSKESGSGRGSETEATTSIRPYLPELFKRLNVKTFLDSPCGDWNWMRQVDLSGVDYIGADVVPSVVANNQSRFTRPGVRFIEADLTQTDLPKADLILCRDCWVHLSFEDISKVLENFRRSGSTWLLVSNNPQITFNLNQFTGLTWRYLNLHLPPFNFPAAQDRRPDHYPLNDAAGVPYHPFQITLWRIADLPKISA